MSFLTTANRIYVTDGGTTVFDTDDRLFTVTDVVTDSITLDEHVATRTISPTTNSPIDINTNITLHSINSSADTVRGAFYVSAAGTKGALLDLGWFNASGSYVHLLYPRFPALGGTTNAGLPSIAVYTFVASGGSLVLNEQVRLESQPVISPDTSTSVTLPGATLQYHLFCGAWI